MPRGAHAARRIAGPPRRALRRPPAMPRTAGRIEPKASSPGSRAMRISLTGRTCQQTSAAAAGARHVSRCLFQPPPVPVWAPSPKVRHSFIIDRGTCCLFSGPTRSTPGRSGSYVHLVGKQAVTQNACRSPCGFDFALRDALVAFCVACAPTTAAMQLLKRMRRPCLTHRPKRAKQATPTPGMRMADVMQRFRM